LEGSRARQLHESYSSQCKSKTASIACDRPLVVDRIIQSPMSTETALQDSSRKTKMRKDLRTRVAWKTQKKTIPRTL